MLVSAINGTIHSQDYSVQNFGVNLTNVSITRPIYDTKQIKNDFLLRPVKNSIHISFTGNSDKKYNQFMFFSAEDKGVGLGKYAQGGEGVVVKEASENWAEHYKKQGIDVRKFLPYHCYDNDGGGLKILKKELDGQGHEQFLSVEQNYKLKDGEKFVILEPPNGGKCAYKEIEDAGITGSVKRINSNLETEDVPYRLFKLANVDENKPITYFIHTKDLAKFNAAYGVGSSLEGAAGAYGTKGAGTTTDAKYATCSQELLDILPKMNTKEHGFYNPANWWLHDRQAFPVMLFASELSSKNNSYFNGLRAHNTFHNPGANYQGRYENPIDFFKIVGSEEDLNALKANKDDFNFVKEMSEKMLNLQKINFARKNENPNDKTIKDYLTMEEMLKDEERERLTEIFEPLIGNFRDERGEYNLCEIPIQGIRKNSHNITAGTVSRNYGKEMKDCNTPEIAEGLTNDLNAIPTIDIVNGSTPANMKTNEIGSFGKPGNGLNTDEIKNGYTPFEIKISSDGKKIENLEEIFEAKQKNTKWLISTIADATQKGQEALNKLFFNKEQLNPNGGSNIEPACVLGGFSQYKEGDKILIGWGRPDEQKGFPTTFEAFLNFIKRDDIPKEEKLKVKLLVGAGGPNPWPKDASHWKEIQDIMQDIAKVDNGAYKGNACYVNGFFANRLANCTTGAILTSEYEPCGITPLEAYSSGNVVLSINTGGAPDFVSKIDGAKTEKLLNANDNKNLELYLDSKSGFLTEHAFKVKPEILGKEKNITEKELHNARRIKLGSEMSDCIKSFVLLYKESSFQKKLMENCLLLPTDWHNNAAFNNGETANQKYMNEVFQLNDELKPTKQRNTEPLKNLKGKFSEYVEKAKETVKAVAEEVAKNVAETSSNVVKKEQTSFLHSTLGKISVIGGSAMALGGIVYASVMHNKTNTPKNNENVSQPKQGQNEVQKNTQVIQENKNPFNKIKTT